MAEYSGIFVAIKIAPLYTDLLLKIVLRARGPVQSKGTTSMTPKSSNIKIFLLSIIHAKWRNYADTQLQWQRYYQEPG